MWYAGRHETSHLCSSTDRRRAAALEKGLRAKDAFVLRRCQILLSSARGERAPRIAAYLGIDDQTVLDALHAFNAVGLACLQQKSSRAHRTRLVFGPSKPSGCARCCTAAHATSATPPVCGRWTWPPRSAWPRASLHPRERGDDPPDAAAPGRWLEAGQALDHQPRSGVCPKKRAARPPDCCSRAAAGLGAGLRR